MQHESSMPAPADILALLFASAQRALPVAVAWHVLGLAALVALARGWRPSTRLVGRLLGLPFLSVGGVSLATGNAFNGIVFTAAGLVLALLGWSASPERVRGRPAAAAALGIPLLAAGWFYPHFLPDLHPAAYLVAAPVGVVPCATLYVVVGLALVCRITGRAATGLLAMLALIYGLMGVAVLGVWLDVGLLAGALALAAGLRARSPLGTSRRVGDAA
jgi:hypothetical protein